jgi:hypothetical protein
MDKNISRWIRGGMGVEAKGIMSPAEMDAKLSRILGGVDIERYY